MKLLLLLLFLLTMLPFYLATAFANEGRPALVASATQTVAEPISSEPEAEAAPKPESYAQCMTKSNACDEAACGGELDLFSCRSPARVRVCLPMRMKCTTLSDAPQMIGRGGKF
ncbi:MAG TPA: hypothetical protein VIH99_07485 [Bdellovibrionota bacterium]|jgi:hypothetical protein